MKIMANGQDLLTKLDWLLSLSDSETTQVLSSLPKHSRLDLAKAMGDRSRELQTAAETSLRSFLSQAWKIIEPGTRYVDSWHIGAICEHLEAVTSGQIKRLLVNVPFRTSKSTIVSVMWPSWVWALDPGHQWLTVSHSDRLATRDCRKMRNIVQADWFQRRWKIGFSRDQNQKTRFENDKMGIRIAAGMTSGITGEGCDTLIVDDPHDRDQAESDDQRMKACEEFDEKLTTRLNSAVEGAIVVIGQRLHETDLFGHLLEQTDQWDHLMIPMRFEPSHPNLSKTTLGWVDPREEGDLMCPPRFPEDAVLKQEETMGPYATAGQYQQRPTSREGGQFSLEWVHLVEDEVVPKMLYGVRGWDKAGTEGSGDYTAGVLVGFGEDGRFYIMDVVHGQWSAARRNPIIKKVAEQDELLFGTEYSIWLEQEGGSGGKESGEFSVQDLAGFTVETESPTGSKQARADPLASQMCAGHVSIVKREWTRAFVAELTTFPRAAHDDQVDAVSLAFRKLAKKMRWWRDMNEPLLVSDGTEEPFSGDEMKDLDPWLQDLLTPLEDLEGDEDGSTVWR